jgi:hypothetical protein
MQRILVDHARAKLTDRRRGSAKRVELDDAVAPMPHEQVLSFNAALAWLSDTTSDIAKLIELRDFGGRTADEAAAALGISHAAADRMWRFVRAAASLHPLRGVKD